MKAKSIPSTWLEREGRRLDCGPYLSGALEAKLLLESLSTRKDALQSLTKDGILGIYHAGREGRTYVDDPKHGVPFLGSTDILMSDLSNLPLLSRKQVIANPLFQIQEGWTLITRSGTIGRMAYSRQDMGGMACSEHVMRVIPNTDMILPGYLFAYLSSRFGIPLIASGTYGAIIQHIEPQHILNVPVPRLGELEVEVHNLIKEAADLRSDAIKIITSAGKLLLETLQLEALSKKAVTEFGCTLVSSSELHSRLDASYHSTAAIHAENALINGRYPTARLQDVVERLFKPPMFKRIWVDDPQYGRQFVSGISAYQYEPDNPRYVSLKTPAFDEFVVRRGWVIFQAAGQIYGLFGRPLLVHGWIEDKFCADDLYRIVPKTEMDGAYLYLFFKTPHGEVLLKRQASGNSIPRVWDPHMNTIRVPWPPEDVRMEFAWKVLRAHEMVEDARLKQWQAHMFVEQAIREGGR